jgi:hypothetical protein
MKQKTKDEKFIMSVYELAVKTADMYAPVNRYFAGEQVGLYPKAIDTICKLLLQANFIKKGTLDDVCLTANGVELVRRLQAI